MTDALADTGLHAAAGDERCWCCHSDIDDFYVLVGELDDHPGIGLVTCTGCAAVLECGKGEE